MKCKTCDGRGIYPTNTGYLKCGTCDGLGEATFKHLYQDTNNGGAYDISSMYPTINNNDLEIKALAFAVHAINRRNGFYDDPVNRPTFIALVHSEVSEALEADRKGDESNFKEELADILIRVLDRCAYENIDIVHEIGKKVAKNKDRGYKHGKEY